MLVEDTIAAISTAPGEGAIALIRISGPDALAIAGKIFHPQRAAFPPPPRRLVFGTIHAADRVIDHGLLAVFPGTTTYTGEPMAEVSCHGGIVASALVLECALAAGARLADPGEFTRRAFVNGRMDLTQAEAVMDVIRAQTPRALAAAAEQLSGRLGAEIASLRHDLLDLLAHLEASIDFPDEGIDPDVGEHFAGRVAHASARVASLLSTARDGRILREGVRLVLCGAPNAGKSSLLNKLLGFERAIVSPVPGTTRDTIEEFASLRGIPFRLTDTAGLRETHDPVEREGVERARRSIAGADLVVRVWDPLAEPVPEKTDGLLVANKADLWPDSQPLPAGTIRVSCLTGEGMDDLVDHLVTAARGTGADGPVLAAINARHQACLERCQAALDRTAAALAAAADPELVAIDLRAALDAVGDVQGAVDAEELLGAIFQNFCIGK